MRMIPLVLAFAAAPAAALDLCAVAELQPLRTVTVGFSKTAEDGSSALSADLPFHSCESGPGYAKWRFVSMAEDLELEIVFLSNFYKLYHERRAGDPSWRWIHWTGSVVRRRDPQSGMPGSYEFHGGSLCFNNHLSLLEPAAGGCRIAYPLEPVPADYQGRRYKVVLSPRRS